MLHMNLNTDLNTDIYRQLQIAAQAYGINELATQLNIQRGTLYNKLNFSETCIFHKLNLQEFIQIIQITGDFNILISLCGLFNYSAFALPKKSKELADSALLDVINDVYVNSGLTHKSMAKALDDGKITQDEYIHFANQAFKFLSAIVTWQDRVKAMVSDDT